MAEAATKVPVKTGKKEIERAAPFDLPPFEILRREIDRVFDDFRWASWPVPAFGRSVFDTEPFWRAEIGMPAVDIAEKESSYEVTAELPGLDEKQIEVKVANGLLTIGGEKEEAKEEKKKDYFRCERRYGSFRRRFRLPDDVDADKVQASLRNGVLTVVLPKVPEAQKKEKTIAIRKS